VHAELESFLRDIQPSRGGFSATSRRKKALARWSRFAGPSLRLSAAQAELLLVGTALRDAAGTLQAAHDEETEENEPDDEHEMRERPKKGLQTGLVQMCGMLKKQRRDEPPALTQSASLALEVLDRMVSSRTPAVIRDVFMELPLALLQQARFGLHALGRVSERFAAFRLVACVMRHNKARNPGSKIELEQLLEDDDAHDMYIEWEDEDAEIGLDELEELEHLEGEHEAARKAPTEWNGVLLKEEENSEDELEATEDFTRILLASVLEESVKDSDLAANGSESEEGTNAAVANQSTSSFKSVRDKISDPLGIRSEDLKTLEGQSGPGASFESEHSNWNPREVLFREEGEDKERETSGVTDDVVSSAGSSPPASPKASTGSMKQDKKRKIRNFIGRVSKRPSGTQSFSQSKAANSGSMKRGGSRKMISFRSFRRRDRTKENSPIKASLSNGTSSPSSPNKDRSSTKNNKRVFEISQEERERHIDRQVLAAIMERHEDRVRNSSFNGSSSFGSLGRRSSGSFIGKPSILPSVESFDPSLFLWRVHKDSSLQKLVKGLKVLESDNADQRGRMKQLVQENFDEFVHSRNTIGQIQDLIRQEALPVNSRASGRPADSHTIRVDRALEAALQTANEHFEPLLEKRRRVRKLKRAAEMLQRVEYLWKLPQELRNLMNENKWIAAVIEFSNAGHHLALLTKIEDENTDATSSFYRDALKDLENCGVQLCEEISAKMTARSDLLSSKSQGATIEPLQHKQMDRLTCTEALSLLLELRDHVPRESRIFQMLDQERDPFLVLARAQQEHACIALESLDDRNPKKALRTAGDILRDYLWIWEDARVCLDPASASSGVEHIFEVNRRKKEDTIDFQEEDNKPAPLLRRHGSVSSSGSHSSAGNADLDEMKSNRARRPNWKISRNGSTDLLFDIRKRSAANCSIKDLGERRKASDEMAYYVAAPYIAFVRKIIEKNLERSATLAVAHDQIEEVLVDVKFMKALGTLNAIAHASKRIGTSSDPISALEALVLTFIERRFIEVETLTKEELETSSGAGLPPQVSGRRDSLPQLTFVIDTLHEQRQALLDVRALIRSKEGVMFWRNAAVEKFAQAVSNGIFKSMNNLIQWVKKKAKSASMETIAVVFADVHHLRISYMLQLKSLLAQVISSSAKFLADDSEIPLLQSLDENLTQVENSLMAQYVQQNGQGLKAFVDEAFEAGTPEDWPNPPIAVRQYALDILLHLVKVVADCSSRVSTEGSRLLLQGLVERLGLVFSVAISSAQEMLSSSTSEMSEGIKLQVQTEIMFLRKVLRSYETGKAKSAFEVCLAQLGVSSEQSGDVKSHVEALAQDALFKSKSISKAFAAIGK